ncbi:MAG TPA: invasin domain 3-containing protein [Gemmatimonadales bacterium]|jgi:adhesin/invasin
MSSGTLAPRIVLVLAAVACGGGDLTLPNKVAEIEIIRGDRQNGTVGQPLGDSLVVRVTDQFGMPAESVTVVWQAEGGGAVDPATSVTASDGRASARRMLGPEAKTYFTLASVEEIPDSVTFTSTALAARLVLTSALPAIAVSGEPLSPQPELQLEDADGSSIAREGVEVTVAIFSGGGGSLHGGTSATSNAEGKVVFTDLALRGSPGTYRLIFATDEAFAPFTTPPIALGVGAPSSIGGVTGDDQTATVGQAVAIDPAVKVLDEDGNPLSGIPVTFTVTRGGGTVSDNTPVTGEDGIATVGEWKLGPSAGANTLSAVVSQLDLEGSPVVFSATGVPGPVSASRSTVTANPANISASNGASASTITVTVLDGFGNPLSGVDVTLAVDGSGHSLTQPGGPTDERGVATGRLSATTTGARTVSATANGVSLDEKATVTVGAGAPSAAASSASVPNGQAGQSTVIEIQLKDALGNPTPGQAGAIAVSISGANTIGSLDASDEGGGRYTVRYTPLTAGTDLVTIRVAGGPLAGSPFPSQVVPGPVNPGTSTAELTVTFFGVGAVVTARDAQGNPVGHGGDTVTMSVNDGPPTTATDNGNGTYQVAVFVLGPQVVRIDLNGQPIQGSPFQVQ